MNVGGGRFDGSALQAGDPVLQVSPPPSPHQSGVRSRGSPKYAVLSAQHSPMKGRKASSQAGRRSLRYPISGWPDAPAMASGFVSPVTPVSPAMYTRLPPALVPT